MASSDVYRQVTDWYVGLQAYIEAEPEFALLHQLYSQLAGGPLPQDFHGFRDLHLRVIFAIRLKIHAPLRDLVVRAIKGYVNSRLGVTVGTATAEQSELALRVERIAQRGYVSLPPVAADVIRDMRDFLSTSPVTIERNGAVETVTLDEARPYGMGAYTPATALACPHLAEVGSSPEVLDLVAQYLGAPPTILTYAAWWSFGGHGKAQGAQFFHVDTDDYKFCKLFVYLTDVDETGGPHTYVAGTHDYEELNRVRAQWPGGAEGFDRWFFKELRKPDQEVVDAFQRLPITLTGKAGTRFVVDTSGIHKGLVPETSDRLVVQLCYGVSPILAADYIKQDLQLMPMGPIHRQARSRCDQKAFDYANRLYLKT
jgi:hypothetical protein